MLLALIYGTHKKLFHPFSPPSLLTSALGHLHHGQERVHRDGGRRHSKTHLAQLQREDLDAGDAAASERQIHSLAGLRVAGTQSSRMTRRVQRVPVSKGSK